MSRSAQVGGEPMHAGLALSGFVLIALLTLLTLQHWAEPRIAEIDRERQTARVVEAVATPLDDRRLRHLRHDVVTASDCRTPLEAVHRLSTADGSTARVLEVLAPNGYSGPIELLIGLSADDRVGTVVLGRHRETPGIGDRIDPMRSPWLAQLHGFGPDTPSERYRNAHEGGDIDALAGATITTRAVLNATEAALQALPQLKLVAPGGSGDHGDGETGSAARNRGDMGARTSVGPPFRLPCARVGGTNGIPLDD